MTRIQGSSLLIFRQNMQLYVAEIVYVYERIAIGFDIFLYSEPHDADYPTCNIYIYAFCM